MSDKNTKKQTGNGDAKSKPFGTSKLPKGHSWKPAKKSNPKK